MPFFNIYFSIWSIIEKMSINSAEIVLWRISHINPYLHTGNSVLPWNQICSIHFRSFRAEKIPRNRLKRR